MYGNGLIVFAALAAIGLGGCGTICNFVARKGDPEVYGGVLYDLEGHIPFNPNGNLGATGGDARGLLLVLAWIPAEFGLSFVGDTMTLPLVVWMRHEDRPPDDDPTPSPPRDHAAKDADDVQNPAVLGPPLPINQPDTQGQPASSDPAEPAEDQDAGQPLWRPLIEDFAQPP